MTRTRVRIEEILTILGVEDRRFLEALRVEGLFVDDELDPRQAEDLRVARVLIDDLGVNAPGVDVVLRLRRRMLALERRTRRLAEALEERSAP